MNIKLFVSVFLAGFIFLLTPLSIAQNPPADQMELIKWMLYYYKQPEPKTFPIKLNAFSKAGLFDEEKRQFPFLGFASTVFRNNSSMITEWVNNIKDLPKNHKKVILIALWLSNTKESNAILKQSRFQSIIEGKNYYNFDTRQEPPNLDRLYKTYGGLLDIQWGRFLATGDKEPVQLIISTLEYGEHFGTIEKLKGKDKNTLSDKEKDQIIKEATFNSAMWSLRSNSMQHPLVKKYCEEIYENGDINSTAKQWLGVLLTQINPDKYKLDKNK
jgi:hypothetical protein